MIAVTHRYGWPQSQYKSTLSISILILFTLLIKQHLMTVDLSVQYFIAVGTTRDQLNMRCSIPMQGSYWSPGTHPTNDIAIEFEIFPNFAIYSCSYYIQPITMKFCTCHDSLTVVTCAKSRCDWLTAFQTRALPILIEFRIRLKYL